jgi:hypothetical protein
MFNSRAVTLAGGGEVDILYPFAFSRIRAKLNTAIVKLCRIRAA